jgi:hypothetical protein
MEVCVRIAAKADLGISNKMFTQTVRELEKDGLICFSGGSKSRIQIKRERKIARSYSAKLGYFGLKMIKIV